MPSDDLKLALDAAPIAQSTKAKLWDAYQSAQTPSDFAAAMDKMPVPTRVKSVLWDLKAKSGVSVGGDDAFLNVTAQNPADQSPYGPTLTDRAVNVLPSAGGLVGGMVGSSRAGAPGGIGGAVIGGATGEAAKQAINTMRGSPDAPASLNDSLTGIGKEGVIQGGLQTAAEAIPMVGNMLGKAAMEHAIRPSIGLAKSFPDIVETAIKERLPVGSIIPGLAKGSEQAMAALGGAGSAVRDLLNKATTAGTKFYATDIAKPVLDLVDEIAKQPIGNWEDHRLGEMLDEFLTRHPGPLTPTNIKELKDAAHDIARPIYEAAAAGNVPGAEQALSARFNSKIAEGAKTGLETIPGVGPAEARAQSLIGASRAIKQAELKRMSMTAEGISSAAGIVASLIKPGSDLSDDLKRGVGTWLVTRGLMSPKTTSRAALALTQPQLQALFAQFPRLAYAVAQQMQTPTAAATQTAPLGTLDLQ